jgi:hypothetical protein
LGRGVERFCLAGAIVCCKRRTRQRDALERAGIELGDELLRIGFEHAPDHTGLTIGGCSVHGLAHGWVLDRIQSLANWLARKSLVPRRRPTRLSSAANWARKRASI